MASSGILPPQAKRVLDKSKVDDLVLLDNVSEEAIVNTLQMRFNSDLIYTGLGPVLISVNPFKQINGLYSPAMVKAYHGAYSYERAPHVYAPAEETFRTLLSTGRNQCMLVSGESGAGKTEATKRILEYISQVSNDSVGRSVASIKDKLLESNPVMEAFGNAKTLRNDNSSRFGKYMVVEFDYGGVPLGATIQTYLLEKPRIVQTQEGERSFHIFYNLCAGARGSTRSELALSQAADYKYLGKTLVVKGMNDEADFGEVDNALDVLIGAERKRHMYRVVASVLHLGNVSFKPSGDKQDPQGCDIVARLLDVDLKKLQRSLTYKTIRTRGETVSSPLKADECNKTRDALAKAVYARAFRQLVAFLNESLLASTKVELTFGLLDIFGFEIFERNSFEQLLINYTNERLQQIFVQLTLESEQREYEAEGLKWQNIQFFNNKIVVDLIEAKKPAGLIAFIDEESIMPQATDKSLLSKLNQNLSKHPHYQVMTRKAKEADSTEFMIKHYAGEVIYSTDGMIEKNTDTLSRDVIEVIGSSTSKLMAVLFPEANEAHDLHRPITAGSQFRTDMQGLMDTLMKCDPHYVRCIKPNDNKQSGAFDVPRVAHQVRYLGLLEVLRVRRAGFAYRHTFPLFVHRYKMTCPSLWPCKTTGDPKRDAKAILDAMAIVGENDAFAVGKTKIFIRRPETLFALEEMRERKMHDVVGMIQGAWRIYKARKYFLALREKSMGIFKGRKRRRNSWVLFFQGDYINAKDSLEFQAIKQNPKLGANDSSILFADRVEVLGKKNKVENRLMVVTEKSIYVADLSWKQSRRIDLRSVVSFTLSTFADGFVVVKVPVTKPQEPDLVFNSVRKSELITVLAENRGSLPLEFSDTISFSFKKVGLFSSKFAVGTLRFVEHTVPGSGFTEVVAPTPSDIGNLTVHVVPEMGSKAQLQLSGSAPERAVTTLAGRAAAGFIDHSNKPTQTPRGPASPTDYSTSTNSSAPLSDVSKLKKAKVLYDYKGSNAKDITVKAGDIVYIIKQHDDGWWEVQKRDPQAGDTRGLCPGSYCET